MTDKAGKKKASGIDYTGLIPAHAITAKDARCSCMPSLTSQQAAAFHYANITYGHLRTLGTEALKITASVAYKNGPPPTVNFLEALRYDKRALEDPALIADELIKLRAFAVAVLSSGEHERCPPQDVAAEARRIFNERNGHDLPVLLDSDGVARVAFVEMMDQLKVSSRWRDALRDVTINEPDEDDLAGFTPEELKSGRNWGF